MLVRVPEQNHILAQTFVFGHTNPAGIHHNGVVDEIGRKNFDSAITTMLCHPSFAENEALKKWFDSQQNILYERYGIEARLKAGYGFDKAHTNGMECNNRLFK
uniref:Uncharacterized protein n=1 Tax=Panagrolaimus superbus TaxID=310955 RepID=A0A914Y783_9BILA